MTMVLLVGCVNLSPPWEGAGNRDSGAAGSAGGGSVLADAAGAGGADGPVAPIEGWPTKDAPGSSSQDDTGGQDMECSAGTFDVAVTGAEPEVAKDSTPRDLGDAATDTVMDLPFGGLDADAAFPDAPSEATGDKGGNGGAAPASGGAGGTDRIDAGAAGAGGNAGTGGNAMDGGAIDSGGSSVCSGRVGVDGGSDIDEGLLAYYRCESASGTSLPDDSGHDHDGVLHTGAGGTAGYSFGTGKVHDALYLSGAQKGYVSLPDGLLDGACEATIATWVWVNSSEDWQRVFDFGRDTNAYMFLTPTNKVSHTLRFGISVGGTHTEQHVDGKAALPTGSWQHVAVVLGPSGGVLYVNGAEVASNPAMTLRPADLGSLPNLYIGRSQFTVDPPLDGRIDSFRVYGRALSPDEINTVYQYSGT
jgi:hypothetical protein